MFDGDIKVLLYLPHLQIGVDPFKLQFNAPLHSQYTEIHTILYYYPLQGITEIRIRQDTQSYSSL
jgi:hypothetical protein